MEGSEGGSVCGEQRRSWPPSRQNTNLIIRARGRDKAKDGEEAAPAPYAPGEGLREEQEVRALKNDWWLKKAKELEETVDNHDYRGLFAGLKAIYGPNSNPVTLERLAEEGDLLPEMQAIKGRCKKRFYPLLNQQGTALSTAGDDICGAISMTELMSLLVSTARTKSPGLDGIPLDILKKAASQLRETLLLLRNRCLHCGQVPQEIRNALIIIIRRTGPSQMQKLPWDITAGHHSENPGKNSLLYRLQRISEGVLPEIQSGFLAGRSTHRRDFYPVAASGRSGGATATSAQCLCGHSKSFRNGRSLNPLEVPRDLWMSCVADNHH